MTTKLIKSRISKKSTKKLSSRKTPRLKLLLAIILVAAIAGIGVYIYDTSKADATSQHTCATKAGGSLWCWGGSNQSGQLGLGYTSFWSNQIEAVPKQLSIAGVTSVSTGSEHTCATKADKSLWCWGSNQSGQLGIGSTTDSNVPKQLSIAGVVSVSAGYLNTCATKTNGTLWCWGYNGYGQLGIGSTTDSNLPKKVNIAGVTSVSTAERHTCATKTDGTLWCWGFNSNNQGYPLNNQSSLLGLGNDIAQTSVPKKVDIAGVASVSAGRSHTCATKTDGTLWCWGNNQIGQLGIGSTTPSNVPMQLYIAGVASVSVGAIHTCATKTDGTLWCWGNNQTGQLGIGSNTDQNVPKQLYIAGVTSVSAAGYHTCATKNDRTLWCWGANADGQLGIGSTTASNIPIRVW